MGFPPCSLLSVYFAGTLVVAKGQAVSDTVKYLSQLQTQIAALHAGGRSNSWRHSVTSLETCHETSW